MVISCRNRRNEMMPTIRQHEESRVRHWNHRPSDVVLVLLVLTGVTFCRAAAPKPTDSPANQGRARSDSGDREGFWPAPGVLRIIIANAAENACRKYDLTAAQCADIGAYTADTWTNFIEDHREDLQPLFNEYLDMRLGTKPPTPERIKQWADKAEPIVDQLLADHRSLREAKSRDQATGGVPSTPDAIEVGLNLAREHIAGWKQGKYEKDTFWGPAVRPDDSSVAKQTKTGVAPSVGALVQLEQLPLDPIAVELLGWARYVEQFASQYELDAGQRDAATSCLLEMTRRANDHRERHLEDVLELERRIAAGPQTAEAQEALKREIVRLYGPIDEMFAELRSRLDQIPTTPQRRRGEQRKSESGPTSGSPVDRP